MFDRFELFAALCSGRVVTLPGTGGVTGRVMGISLEDGSGFLFNVTVGTPLGQRTVFVRCKP